MLFSCTKSRKHASSAPLRHFYRATSFFVIVGLLWSSLAGLPVLPVSAQDETDADAPHNTYLPFVSSETTEPAQADPVQDEAGDDEPATVELSTDENPREFNPADYEEADPEWIEPEWSESEVYAEDVSTFDAELMAQYEAELAADPEYRIDYDALYTAIPDASLAARHPDAGLWVSYKGPSLPISEVQKPHIVGVASSAYWKDLHTAPNKYNWANLDYHLNYAINRAGKKTYVVITAGYCPDLDFPAFIRNTIATRKTKNRNGCYPLQFWDPNYVTIYKTFIRAMADHLAAYDASDARPRETDILFVRAQVMAENMENLPSDYANWEWADYKPAPNGRIYKVNLTAEVAHAYHKEIVLYYQQELRRAYQKYGLTPPVAAAKGASYNNTSPNAPAFISAGVWFDQHNNSPSPEGWRYDMVKSVRTGETRSGVESNKFWPTSLLSQYTYWEILVALHSGVEFIGQSLAPHKSAPSLQPRGPMNFPENQEALQFAQQYAGYQRNPTASPGAWVALRGGYPEFRFGSNMRQYRIWTNYDFLMSQYRPQDSVMLFGLDHTVADVGVNVPQVQREKKQQWSDEQTVCAQQYFAWECEYLKQSPDKYLGLSNSKHLHTYNSTSLGKVRYCGTDAFCNNAGATTRTETMLWARRTDGKNGHPYMRFKIDDQFASSLGGKAIVRIVYLDQGTGKWQLRYDSASNADKSGLIVTKTNTGYWKEVTVTLNDVRFANRQEGGTDIALYNMGDDDDIFHIIEVKRTNQANTNAQDVRDEPTDAELRFKAYLPVIQ